MTREELSEMLLAAGHLSDNKELREMLRAGSHQSDPKEHDTTNSRRGVSEEEYVGNVLN